jgi:hypothetical protein
MRLESLQRRDGRLLQAFLQLKEDTEHFVANWRQLGAASLSATG